VAENYQESVKTDCIREPDPKRWDPDPTMIASLPRRLELGQFCARRQSPPDLQRRPRVRDCLYRDNGQWRWRLASRPCARGYTSIASASCP